MKTPDADAIAYAIAARSNGDQSARIDLRGHDAEELGVLFADHLAGMTPADAMGEALAVGFIAGRRAATLPASVP